MYFTTAPSHNLEICVIIPVKDEEETILKCLEALRIQKDQLDFPIGSNLYEVLVLANNCQDNTYKLIKDYQNLYPTFPLFVEEITFSIETAHIGTARRFLMDVACDRFASINKPEGIIASTDGDTEVDIYWIDEIRNETNKGCDVVGGEITMNMEDCPAKQYYLQDIKYQNLIVKLEFLIDPQEWNPWPTHFHCFGASFAIKSNVYQKAGRLPQVSCLEDVAFIKALESIDAKIRRSPKVKVFTSSRKIGRVERGLSQQLSWFESLGNEQQKQWVECADSSLFRIKIKKSFRDLWNSRNLNWTAAHLERSCQYLNESNLQEWLQKTKYFGELWILALEELNRNNWFDQWGKVKIEEAIESLNLYISEYEKTPEYY